MRGYVYQGRLHRTALEALRNRLGGVTFSFDLKTSDFSGDLRDEGMTFGETFEIRWQRCTEDLFDVLVLSEDPCDDPSLTEVPGEWEVEKIQTYLVPLHAPHFSPSFERYPSIGQPSGRCVCCVYSQNGVTYFVSPRRLIS
ncbi:MAG: hypothetical protein N2205_09195 [Candidatus Caldatribacterium sp.]|nr:hypothetical protein [Candidatus Caldatribacterium sp.]